MTSIRDVAREMRRVQRRLTMPLAWGARRTLSQAGTLYRTNGLLNAVLPYTMLHEDGLIDLAVETERVLGAGIPGAFVECGTWKGGAAFLMAGILERRGADPARRVWMFDSFEGLPATQEIDGLVGGMPWGPEHPWYQDNCTANVQDVEIAARRLGVDRRVAIVPGWFDQKLPVYADEIGPIALLRLDGDLYESTKTCLETLYERVVPGGSVILDDYYAWDGCAIALHEFLSAKMLPHRILAPSGDGQPVVIRIPR